MMHESGDRMWSAMKVQTIGKYKGKWLKVDLGGGGGYHVLYVYIIYIYMFKLQIYVQLWYTVLPKM